MIRQETKDTIKILNERKVAKDVLENFNRMASEQELTQDSEEYKEMREIAVLLAIYSDKEALENEAKRTWNIINGFDEMEVSK